MTTTKTPVRPSAAAPAGADTRRGAARVHRSAAAGLALRRRRIAAVQRELARHRRDWPADQHEAGGRAQL